ncbi:MAG: toxin-activating lysine-acyltransferase [Hyphomicrobium sp.]|nr:toxin-activating lysine-acyltransferase [Hyphomicrobium sp.]
MVTASQSQGTGSGPNQADARAAAFGRILALLMASPRHSGMTLADANALVAPAVALGQIAMMGAKQTEEAPMALVAAAWWAFVSPEVDQRLTDNREPHLRLEAGEWKCGDQPWLIETIGDPRVVNELVKRLAVTTFKDTPAKLRAILPDGRVAVGRLEPRPPGSEPPASPQTG